MGGSAKVDAAPPPATADLLEPEQQQEEAKIEASWHSSQEAAAGAVAVPAELKRALTQTYPKRLMSAFADFDTDRSGALDAAELKKILTWPGSDEPLTEAEAQAFIDKHNQNGDGLMQVDELVAAWKEMQVGVFVPSDKQIEALAVATAEHDEVVARVEEKVKVSALWTHSGGAAIDALLEHTPLIDA